MSLAFFEIGFGEMLVVGFIALLLFGGDLPRVMRSLGTVYRGFRRSLDDLKIQALRPDATRPPRPASSTTPYRPSAMPLPPSPGVAVTPPAFPGAGGPEPREAARGESAAPPRAPEAAPSPPAPPTPPADDAPLV